MAAKLRCFVAMAFGKKDTDAIFSALRKTLGPLGVNAQRVDRIEHNDNIDTRIISEIEAAVTGVCTTPFMCRSDASRSPQRRSPATNRANRHLRQPRYASAETQRETCSFPVRGASPVDHRST